MDSARTTALVFALRQLARDISFKDGVANAYLADTADYIGNLRVNCYAALFYDLGSRVPHGRVD